MVNAKVSKGSVEISISGDTPTVMVETSLIVYSVYAGIRERNAVMAEIFKRYFCEKGSAIFDVGDEELSVTKKEPKFSNTDALDMFINRLDELSAILKADKAKKEDK